MNRINWYHVQALVLMGFSAYISYRLALVAYGVIAAVTSVVGKGL